MRTIFIFSTIVFFAIVFSSCQSNGPEDTLLTPTVKYKLNNVERVIVGNESYRISKIPNPDYLSVHLLYISVQVQEHATLLIVSNTTPSLIVGDYYTVPPITYGSSNSYVARVVLKTTTPSGVVTKEYHGEFSDVKITSISNGYVSGLFSATLKLSGGTEQINITDGEFSNYRIVL
jgi:hypothetical protein